MAENKIYLSVAKTKRQPENDGYVAVISQGHIQHGDKECIVLDVEVVKNMKEAKRWYKKALIERPWEPRN